MNTKQKLCAFLTMDNTEGWSIDADLAVPPLQALGWQVEWIPWKSPHADWGRFDAVYICTPWDYPEDPDRLLSVLEDIDRSTAVLANDIRIVRWNLRKTYLRDLERSGAAIVPSLWRDAFDDTELPSFFDRHGSERIIIKPVISTNATDTFLLDRQSAAQSLAALRQTFARRAFMVQPFIASIQTEGEYSLFYFNREFSHATCKTPKANDFRVQEEHGASLVSVDAEPALLAAGEKAMSLVDPMPVYARCDFVRDDDGRYLVMELELIEPSMYLRMHEGAAAKFAAAFEAYWERHRA